MITAGGGFQASDRETGSDLPRKEREREREGDYSIMNFPRRAMMLFEA